MFTTSGVPIALSLIRQNAQWTQCSSRNFKHLKNSNRSKPLKIEWHLKMHFWTNRQKLPKLPNPPSNSHSYLRPSPAQCVNIINKIFAGILCKEHKTNTAFVNARNTRRHEVGREVDEIHVNVIEIFKVDHIDIDQIDGLSCDWQLLRDLPGVVNPIRLGNPVIGIPSDLLPNVMLWRK